MFQKTKAGNMNEKKWTKMEKKSENCLKKQLDSQSALLGKGKLTSWKSVHRSSVQTRLIRGACYTLVGGCSTMGESLTFSAELIGWLIPEWWYAPAAVTRAPCIIRGPPRGGDVV
jgi:hypothetical protein